jgi:hypothetical protein
VRELEGGAHERKLFLAFSPVARKCGKADLKLTEADLANATAVSYGWDPSDWTVDQAARARLLLAFRADNGTALSGALDQLCRAAEIAELMAVYRSLPILPLPEAHVARAAEGCRTNMKGVFLSVAHRNPYPSDHLDEGAWNQMVLKARFVGATLHPIVGIDARANAALAQMLRDYAHERWAANREVSSELWRCVAPFADEDGLADIERALGSEDERERSGAALALIGCRLPAAGALLARTAPDLAKRARSGELTWAGITGQRTTETP